MATTNCELCGRVIPAAESSTGGFLKTYCGCDRQPKRGRPPTERGAYNELPGRKFGRVSDADWQEIRDACELSGLSLVAWALPMMLAKARREKSIACAVGGVVESV